MMVCSVLMVSLLIWHHSPSLRCQFVTDWTGWKAEQNDLLATAHIANVHLLIMKSNDAKGLIGFIISLYSIKRVVSATRPPVYLVSSALEQYALGASTVRVFVD